MSDPHDRFLGWVLDGARSEPPRDLALHASVCVTCHRRVAALDALAGIDPSHAWMPASVRSVRRSRPLLVAPIAALALVASLFVGLGALRIFGERPDAQPPTATGAVLAATGTPDATPALSASGDPLVPSPTPAPTTKAPATKAPGALPVPARTAAATRAAAPSPPLNRTPTPRPSAPGRSTTPTPTASASATASPSPSTPTSTPTATPSPVTPAPTASASPTPAPTPSVTSPTAIPSASPSA